MIKRTICIENACFLKYSNQQMIVSYSHIKGMEQIAGRAFPVEKPDLPAENAKNKDGKKQATPPVAINYTKCIIHFV